MRNTRRSFIGTTLATTAISALVAPAFGANEGGASASGSGSRPKYLVVYRRGAAWEKDKPMREQRSMREHFAYYVALHRKGLLISAGGFTDDSGGAAVFEAANDAEAAAILAADPAVTSGVFRYELQQWKLNPWEEISKARAARGE
jgi:uncharacterized protein YciI